MIKCEVCQINKQDFDNIDLNFHHHLQKEHNIWDYFDYISQIRKKPMIDCNLLELNIRKKLENLDFSWIPLQRAQIIGIYIF